MSKYVCKRDDVYSGILLIKWDLDNQKCNTFKDLLNDRFICFNYKLGRSLLFNVNNKGYANDLIYNTPYNYPVLELCNDEYIDSRNIITRYVKLDNLLKYMGYNKDLSNGDLNDIYNKLLVHSSWLKHYRHLFGNSDGEEILSYYLYKELCDISKLSSKPHKDEPGFMLIKKR